MGSRSTSRTYASHPPMASPQKSRDEPYQTENLQRPSRVAQEELDRDEVETHTNRAREAVFGFAVQTRPVVHRHLGD